MTMTEKFCQSCGMPLENLEEMCGTNTDGSLNEDYCKYCFDKGAFSSDMSMNEMIEVCVPHMASADSGMTEDQARAMMQEFFPKLKRWKQS